MSNSAWIAWAQWADLHMVRSQKSAINCAKATVPTSINREKPSAVFDGKHVCIATLSDCSCPDFRFGKKSSTPCKHMYCLASELGLVDLNDLLRKNELHFMISELERIRGQLSNADKRDLIMWLYDYADRLRDSLVKTM